MARFRGDLRFGSALDSDGFSSSGRAGRTSGQAQLTAKKVMTTSVASKANFGEIDPGRVQKALN